MLSSNNTFFAQGLYEYVDTGERFRGKPDSIHIGAGDDIDWNIEGDITTPKEEIELYYKNGRRIRKVG